MTRLVLASASPRRREILTSLGVRFELLPVQISETAHPGEPAEALALRLAHEKAAAAVASLGASSGDPARGGARGSRTAPPTVSPPVGASILDPARLDARSPAAGAGTVQSPGSFVRQSAGPGTLVLGADTIVALDGTIFGKPASEAEAVATLERLSGRAHDVLTGLALHAPGTGRAEAGIERTRVRFARLGAETIQAYVASGAARDKAGAYGIQEPETTFIEGIEGSYTNVVGLPVELLSALLGRFDLTLEELTRPA